MKIKLYFFGKQNDVSEREKELIRRINFRKTFDIIPLNPAGIKDAAKAKTKESDLFLSKVDDQDYVIAFDEKGTEMTSPEFSQWLEETWVNEKSVQFVIGGAHGLDPKILKRANYILGLGKMTWTKDLCRHMALEQIYRALEIRHGSSFHKA